MQKFIAWALVCSFIFTGCNDNKPEDMIRTPSNKPYEITLNNNNSPLKVQISDGHFQFPSLSGKAVLLEFFTTWCPSCIELTPTLIRLQQTYNKDLVIIGVVLEDGLSPETILQYKTEKNIPYILTIGKSNFELARAVGGVRGVPSLFLYNKKGELAARYTGAEREEILKADIEKVVH